MSRSMRRRVEALNLEREVEQIVNAADAPILPSAVHVQLKYAAAAEVRRALWALHRDGRIERITADSGYAYAKLGNLADPAQTPAVEVPANPLGDAMTSALAPLRKSLRAAPSVMDATAARAATPRLLDLDKRLGVIAEDLDEALRDALSADAPKALQCALAEASGALHKAARAAAREAA